MDVFFYGLFMDLSLLEARGLRPRAPRVARARDFRLQIGDRATLLPATGESVYGLLVDVSRTAVNALYDDPTLSAYRPETIDAEPIDGSPVRARCYNLPADNEPGPINAEYAARLATLAEAIGLPRAYVEHIRHHA